MGCHQGSTSGLVTGEYTTPVEPVKRLSHGLQRDPSREPRPTTPAQRLTQQEKGERGKRAEKAVARRLWWEGYRILERNYATPLGEVDIIARKGDTVAFVEVRAKQEGSPVAPKDTVGHAKQRRIDAAASIYLKTKRLSDVSVRYDIAEVWLDERGKPKQIEIIEGAFGDPRRR